MGIISIFLISIFLIYLNAANDNDESNKSKIANIEAPLKENQSTNKILLGNNFINPNVSDSKSFSNTKKNESSCQVEFLIKSLVDMCLDDHTSFNNSNEKTITSSIQSDFNIQSQKTENNSLNLSNKLADPSINDARSHENHFTIQKEEKDVNDNNDGKLNQNYNQEINKTENNINKILASNDTNKDTQIKKKVISKEIIDMIVLELRRNKEIRDHKKLKLQENSYSLIQSNMNITSELQTNHNLYDQLYKTNFFSNILASSGPISSLLFTTFSASDEKTIAGNDKKMLNHEKILTNEEKLIKENIVIENDDIINKEKSLTVDKILTDEKILTCDDKKTSEEKIEKNGGIQQKIFIDFQKDQCINLLSEKNKNEISVDKNIIESSNDIMESPGVVNMNIDKFKCGISGDERYINEFESIQGSLHILNTIINHLQFLTEKSKLGEFEKLHRITGILIYKDQKGDILDYWGKLKFKKETISRSSKMVFTEYHDSTISSETINKKSIFIPTNNGGSTQIDIRNIDLNQTILTIDNNMNSAKEKTDFISSKNNFPIETAILKNSLKDNTFIEQQKQLYKNTLDSSISNYKTSNFFISEKTVSSMPISNIQNVISFSTQTNNEKDRSNLDSSINKQNNIISKKNEEKTANIENENDEQDVWIDETGLFEGLYCDSFEEIPIKGILTINGFFQDNKLSDEELCIQFNTIKILIEKISKDLNIDIPTLFKKNNDISILDRLIFVHSYRNRIKKEEMKNGFVRVCVCKDNLCVEPCSEYRWVNKKYLE